MVSGIESERKRERQKHEVVSGTDLVAVFLEETRGVHAIGNSATDDREPVEDHGRLIGVLEEQLV